MENKFMENTGGEGRRWRRMTQRASERSLRCSLFFEGSFQSGLVTLAKTITKAMQKRRERGGKKTGRGSFQKSWGSDSLQEDLLQEDFLQEDFSQEDLSQQELRTARSLSRFLEG